MMYSFDDSVERLRKQLKDTNNPVKMAGIDKRVVVDNSLILFYNEGKTIRVIKIVDDVAKTLMMERVLHYKPLLNITYINEWFDWSSYSDDDLIARCRRLLKFL